MRPEQNLLEAARSLLGKAGLILVPVYAVYFICFGGFCLSLLQLFMANVMEPHASLPLLAIVTALAASYAVWKGIETIGRTAALVSGFAAGGLILILLFLSVKFDPLHFTPCLLYTSSSSSAFSVFLVSIMGRLLFVWLCIWLEWTGNGMRFQRAVSVRKT